MEQSGFWAMQQLNFLDLLTRLGINGAQIAAIAGSMIGRMAGVGSELATHTGLMNLKTSVEHSQIPFALSLSKGERDLGMLTRWVSEWKPLMLRQTQHERFPLASTAVFLDEAQRPGRVKALHVRKADRAEPEQMAIYRALKVNPGTLRYRQNHRQKD